VEEEEKWRQDLVVSTKYNIDKIESLRKYLRDKEYRKEFEEEIHFSMEEFF